MFPNNHVPKPGSKSMSSDVHVYVARTRIDGEMRTTVWSASDKARGWIEDKTTGIIEWERRSSVEWVGTVTGEFAGTVRRAPVMDPISLATRYPEYLPSSRHIPTE